MAVKITIWTLVLLLLSLSKLYVQFEQYSYIGPIIQQSIEDDLNHAKKSDYGTLTGDVQNWAAIIQNYIIQVNFLLICNLRIREIIEVKQPYSHKP